MKSFVADLLIAYLVRVGRENQDPDTKTHCLFLGVGLSDVICMHQHPLYEIPARRFDFHYDALYLCLPLIYFFRTLKHDPYCPYRLILPLQTYDNRSSAFITHRIDMPLQGKGLEASFFAEVDHYGQ